MFIGGINTLLLASKKLEAAIANLRSNYIGSVYTGDYDSEEFSLGYNPYNAHPTHGPSVTGRASLNSPFRGDGYFGIKFNGTTESVELSDNGAFDFGVGNTKFTIETWINLPSYQAGTIFSRGGGVNSASNVNGLSMSLDISGTGALTFNFQTAGSANVAILVARPLALKTWIHVAISYDGTSTYFHINGVLSQINSSAYAAPSSNGLIHIGAKYGNSSFFNGFMSGFRVIKGNNQYGVTRFVPPKQVLTPVANTSFLGLHNRNLNTFYYDTNASPLVLTPTTTLGVNVFSPYNTTPVFSAIDFLPSSGVSYPSHAGLQFSSLDFTIDLWVKLSAVNPADTFLLTKRADTVSWNSWGLSISASSRAPTFLYHTTAMGSAWAGGTSSVSIPLGVWTRITVKRVSSNLKIYVNGEVGYNAAITGAIDTNNAPVAIGHIINSLHFTGQISNVSISVGSDTIDVSALIYEPHKVTAQTGLYACVDSLLDLSNHNLTASTNGFVRTIQAGPFSDSVADNDEGFNTGSVSITASGAASLLPDARFVFNGDFTIEGWCFPYNDLNNQAIFLNSYTAAQGVTNWSFTYTGNRFNFFYSGANSIVSQKYYPNQWYHLAATRNGNTINFFVNGVLAGSATSSDVIGNSTDSIIILSSTAGVTFKGAVSCFSINNTTALYTSDFQTPSVPSADVSGTVASFLKGTQNVNNQIVNDTKKLDFYVGFVTQGSVSPYSPNGWAVSFSSAANYLSTSLAAFATGTSAFTIEAWVWCTELSIQAQPIISSTVSNTDTGLYLQINTDRTLSWGGNATIIGTSVAQVVLHQWNHVALTRTAGGVWRVYIDGVDAGGSVTNTRSLTSSTWTLGAKLSTAPANRHFRGLLSNVRLSTGVKYSSDFTVATESEGLTSTTLFLLAASPHLTTLSIYGPTTTIVGTPATVCMSPFVIQKKYKRHQHGGSAYFDGTENINSLNTTGVSIGSGNFTIECWVNFKTVAADKGVFHVFSPSAMSASNQTAGVAVLTSATGWVLSISSGTLSYTGDVALPNTWIHLAVCRHNGFISLHVNGKRVINNSEGSIYPGSNNNVGTANNTTKRMEGFVSDFRVCNEALYVGPLFKPNFNKPVGSIPSAICYMPFNTAAVTDQTGRSNIKVVQTSGQIGVIRKFGKTAIRLDNLLSVPIYSAGVNNIIDRGNFTIEGWLYMTATATPGGVFSTAITDTFGNIAMQINGNQFQYWIGTSAAIQSGPVTGEGTLPLETWTHFALVRVGNQVKLYVQGKVIITATNSDNISGSNLQLGSRLSGSGFFNGHLDDFCFTRYAKYFNDFTPPGELLLIA